MPVDKSSAFFALLCFLLSASQVLWGQSESIQDSLHHPGYHFLMIKNPESQAALDGFETDTPYTYFNLSLKNNLYQSFFPPVRTSSDSIQFLTLSGHNRQRLLNGRINDINYIEFNYYTNHHLGTSSRYLLLSFLPAVITAFFDKRQEPLPTLLIGLTYLLPAFTLSGAFTAAAPERYHLDMTEYLERRTSWNWELGYSVGKFSHSIYDYWQYQKAEDTFAQGIYLNLKRNYSPFSFALRLYYMPHPEYDRHFYYDPYYDDYYPEEKVKAGYDMLINPSLKTTIFSSNHFKLNLITGFMTEIRYDYQEPEYYSDDEIYIWGTIEPELQYYLGKHLVLSLSISSQYNWERSRFPLFLGLQYAHSYLNEPGLNLKRMSISPLYQKIFTDEEYHNLNSSAYGVAIALGLGKLTELTYMLMINQTEEHPYYFNEKNTIIQTIKYTAFTPGPISVGLSFGTSFGEIYDAGIEFIAGPVLKLSFSQNFALLGNFETGLIGLLGISDYTSYWYSAGFSYQF